MDFQGKVIWIGEKRQGVSNKGTQWSSQDYAIQDAAQQYPKTMCFNVFGEDKIKNFNIQMGEEIKVSFDIDARQYNGKFYNDIRAWKVERPNAGQALQPAPQQSAFQNLFAGAATQQESKQPAQQTANQEQPKDDLPF